MVLKEAFEAQAESCEQLGSPFTARVLRVCAKENPVTGAVWERLQNWPNDVSANGDAIALRFMGALHGLVLKNMDPDLSSVYPPNYTKLSDHQIWQQIQNSVDRHSDYILERMQLPPQTNEVRRSSAIMLGAQVAAKETGCPKFMTSEIGASSGLNLFWDKFKYKLGNKAWGDENSAVLLAPDVKGSLPDLLDVEVVERAGCDLNPLDLRSDIEKSQLLSYIWPDQEDRKQRTQSAIDVFCENDVKVDRANAIDWLESRISGQPDGVLHLIYHTVVLQYFPDPVREEFLDILKTAGKNATDKRPLAWLSMEADGNPDGALLRLTIWPSEKVIDMARVDFHGRWLSALN